MKLKKIIYTVIVSLMVILLITFSCKIYKAHNKSLTLILGNPIENIEGNDTFTSSFMTSSFLLKMIENDASKQVDDKVIKLSKLIQDSNTIIINIGSVDVANIDDEELLTRQSQITITNIKKVVELVILKSKNTDIKLCLLDESYSLINEQIKQITLKNGIKINNMSFFNSINICIY